MKEISITADGNCFFRALSFHCSKSEKHHEYLRSTLVKFILSNDPVIKNILSDTGQNYIKKTKLNLYGVWVSELDILLSSLCFDLNINIIQENSILQKFSPSLVVKDIDKTLNTMWLKHSGNHFSYLFQ